MRLSNKVAIVTGAARGIGREVARLFASEGAIVVITDILKEELSIFEKELKKSGYNVLSILQDVSKEYEWEKVVDQTIKYFSHLDILVNNAGIGGKEGVSETSLEQWQKILDINLQGAFLGIKYSAEAMKKHKNGSIINISSIYGIIGTGMASSYHASKAGIAGLSKTAAIEYAKFNIRVNTIHPGVIQTDMTKEKLANPNIQSELFEKTPLPFFGEPRDIAYGALYLASDESRFVTGSSLIIDGGYTSC